MDIHVAVQIILAAEAPGALTARVGFLAGFRGHFDYLWDWNRSLDGCMVRILGCLQGLDKKRIVVIQGL